MHKIILTLMVLMFLSSCQKSNDEIITARQWKGGPLLGDLVTFSEDKNAKLYISNDTIYNNAKPQAIVNSITYEVDHYVMKVISLDGKQKATYFDKGSAN